MAGQMDTQRYRWQTDVGGENLEDVTSFILGELKCWIGSRIAETWLS